MSNKKKAIEIANAYIYARCTDNFGPELFEYVLVGIEAKYCCVSCVESAKEFGHASDRYIKDVRRGFIESLKQDI
jgi:hypothetical protein